MPVLSKVILGVKHRMPANPPPQQPTPAPLSQAPDLRRWSDFMNPFPPVCTGGYTKYYQTRGPSETALRFQLPPLCELNYSPQPSRAPPIQKSTPPKAKTIAITRPTKPTSQKLASIPESSLETYHPQTPRERASLKGSLRRRKRRVLRTPSIERDFGSHAQYLPESHPTVDRSGSISSSQSASTYGSHRSNSSTESHSSQSSSTASTMTDMPLTPVDFNDNPGNRCQYDVFRKAKQAIDDEFDGPFKRPDSRSTYRTARTHFSEF